MSGRIASLFAEIGIDSAKLQRGLADAKSSMMQSKADMQKLADQTTRLGSDFRQTGGIVDDWIGTLRASTPENARFAQSVTRITTAFSDGKLTAQQAAAQLEEVKRQMAAAVPVSDKFKTALHGISNAIAGITGAAAVVGVAVTKIFDFGEAGANLAYAQKKFDNLSVSIGTTSDALTGKLRGATKGLVADSDLVASAGAFMALGLAKTSEEVVRLTRVAGALGMDMNQLVLTLTNQTTMRFDQLGVSVDGFDEKVAALKKTGMDANSAFKEAFLQQAEEQVKRVGDKADSAAGNFSKLDTSLKNLSDTLKMKFAPPIESAAVALNTLLTAEDQIVAVTKDRQAEVRASSKSYAEYREEMNRVMKLTKLNAQVVLGHAGSLREVESALGILDETTYNAITINGDYLDTAERMRTVTDEVASSMTAADHTYVAATGSTLILDEAMLNASKSTEIFKEKIIGLDDINPQFGSKIVSAIDDLKFQMAGGLPLQQVTDEIIAAFNAGKITPEQAKDMLDEAFIAEQALQVDMDKITADEAAQNVKDTLGLSLDEAKQKVLDTKGELDKFPKELHSRLIFTTEGAPSVGIGSAYDPERGEGKASGGPVIAGSPYWVGEQGPEPFIPSQNGRILSREDAMKALSSGAGNVTITQNIYTQIDYEEAAARIADVVRRA